MMSIGFVLSSYGFMHKVFKWNVGAHVFVQLLAFVCFVAGYVCIFMAHYLKISEKTPFPFLGWESPWYKKIHVWMAYTTLTLWLVQVFSGATKYSYYVQKGARAVRWHGDSGWWTYMLMVCTMMTTPWVISPFIDSPSEKLWDPRPYVGPAQAMPLWLKAMMNLLLLGLAYNVFRARRTVMKIDARSEDSFNLTGAGVDMEDQ